MQPWTCRRSPASLPDVGEDLAHPAPHTSHSENTSHASQPSWLITLALKPAVFLLMDWSRSSGAQVADLAGRRCPALSALTVERNP